jgi:lactam utilization protein B
VSVPVTIDLNADVVEGFGVWRLGRPVNVKAFR